MTNILFIAAAGSVGAVLRYLIHTGGPVGGSGVRRHAALDKRDAEFGDYRTKKSD